MDSFLENKIIFYEYKKIQFVTEINFKKLIEFRITLQVITNNKS